ncbi:MAG: hypothetical protein ABIY56_05990 [Dokdonella sp.]
MRLRERRAGRGAKSTGVRSTATLLQRQTFCTAMGCPENDKAACNDKVTCEKGEKSHPLFLIAVSLGDLMGQAKLGTLATKSALSNQDATSAP